MIQKAQLCRTPAFYFSDDKKPPKGFEKFGKKNKESEKDQKEKQAKKEEKESEEQSEKEEDHQDKSKSSSSKEQKESFMNFFYDPNSQMPTPLGVTLAMAALFGVYMGFTYQ